MRRITSPSLRPLARRTLPGASYFARLSGRAAGCDDEGVRESGSASGSATTASSPTASDSPTTSPVKDSPSPTPSTSPPTTTTTSTSTTTTATPPLPPSRRSAPFHLCTGTSLFAKRAPRPFPPPFLSPPTTSFSDALSTHQWSWDRRRRKGTDMTAVIGGEKLRGVTNGDDAIVTLVEINRPFLGCRGGTRCQQGEEPTPIEYLQRAYEQTLEATTQPTEWQGTTTATGAQLHYENNDADGAEQPVLYVTNLGDSQVLVLRPRNSKVIFKTKAQWHWFDCPRQLGTNSPDTPKGMAVVNKVVVEVGDVVLAVSDGVTDNLWEHEVEARGKKKEKMQFVAEKLMNAARVIAQDPFAESPFMEHAIEEGLAMEG
ncbi:hypothetical protein ACLOAV_004222 [Pseudogymnoascus australis]